MSAIKHHSANIISPNKFVWIKTRSGMPQVLFYKDGWSMHRGRVFHTDYPMRVQLSKSKDPKPIYCPEDLNSNLCGSMKVDRVVYNDTGKKYSSDNPQNEIQISSMEVTFTPENGDPQVVMILSDHDLNNYLKSFYYLFDEFNSDSIRNMYRHEVLPPGETQMAKLHFPSSIIKNHFTAGKRRSHRSKSRRTRRRTHRKN